MATHDANRNLRRCARHKWRACEPAARGGADKQPSTVAETTPQTIEFPRKTR